MNNNFVNTRIRQGNGGRFKKSFHPKIIVLPPDKDRSSKKDDEKME
jgi:hypothetical protein